MPNNPYSAQINKLHFHRLEHVGVVSRYRDPQLQDVQVVENYSYLFNLRPNIYK